MKRMLAFLLLPALILSLLGCAGKSQKISDPVSFYYCRSELTYGAANSVILAETVDAAGHREDPRYLISQYLAGPGSDTLTRTFPEGTTLMSLTTANGTADLILSDTFAGLSGMDLTIACACLTLTVLDLTGVSAVRIRTVSELLDGAEEIIMDRNCLLLLDDAAIRPAE